MATFGRRTSAKQWGRLAMKLGLFLTDAKLWSAVNSQIRERAEDVGDVVRDSYEGTSSRLADAKAAIRGDNHWVGPVTGFVGGVGIGIGLGMLLAPVSGEEARSAIRDKAMEMKDRAVDMTNRAGEFATGSSRFRSTAPTGTGD